MIDYRATDDSGSFIEAINHCTLEIHRAAREASFSGFPMIALKLIGEVV